MASGTAKSIWQSAVRIIIWYGGLYYIYVCVSTIFIDTRHVKVHVYPIVVYLNLQV